MPLSEAVKAFKRARIRQALEEAGGNRDQAASLLGLAPPNLSWLMKNIGLRSSLYASALHRTSAASIRTSRPDSTLSNE